MRVGILTYGLDRPLTGISRYTTELVRALLDLEEDLQITLLSAGELGPLENEKRLDVIRLAGCGRLPGLLTRGNQEVARGARCNRLQIIHDPTGVAPFLNGKNCMSYIITINDVFVYSSPGHSTLAERLIYQLWLPFILRNDKVIVLTPSQQSAIDIHRHLRVPLDRLHVIPYGIAHIHRHLPEKQTRQNLKARLGISQPFILFVGAINHRKNLPIALRAFSQIRHLISNLRFVLAGPRAGAETSLVHLAGDLGVDEQLIWTGPVSDSDLSLLYNSAEFLVFPSLYEGFGFPPLEAIACGTPVICSRSGSLPEVVGEAAITFDPMDLPALIQAMTRLLQEKDLHKELREKGLRQAKMFSWEHCARQTLAVYRHTQEIHDR